MSEKTSEVDRERIEYELRGKTLKVYFYLLKHRNGMGIRKIQKALGFSSPSIAVHHVEKLISLGIVGKDEQGGYTLTKHVDVGVLQAFASVGRFTFPRLGFYAGFFTTIAFAYVFQNLGGLELYALIGTVGGVLAFWYEAYRAWRKKPF